MPKPELEYFDPQVTDGFVWRPAEGDQSGHLTEMILSEDPDTGDLTRLLRLAPGTDTSATGPVTHEFWEEVYMVAGELVDLRLQQRFTPGMYACRPPGMVHGPWRTDVGCVAFEIRSYR